MASNKKIEDQESLPAISGSKRIKLISPPESDHSENRTVGDQGNISRTSLDIARLVIKNQIPLNIVENEHFSILINHLQPMSKLPSRAALLSAILEVYQEEKGRLVEYFEKLSGGRLHLRITLWKDDYEKIIFCCYSVHFVDDSWVLKKKIIALKNLGHENEVEPSIVVDNTKSFVADWNFVNKLTSVTLVDAAFSSDQLANELEEVFLEDKTFVFIAANISSKPDDGIIKIKSEWLVEFYDIYKKLSEGETRDYPYMNAQGSKLNLGSQLVAVAAILDPRYKLALVVFLYNKLYGNSTASIHLTNICNVLDKWFNIYVRELYRGTSMQDDTYNSLASLNGDIEEDTVASFQSWYDSKRKVPTDAFFWKSELDKYLEEPIISYEGDDEFKVLDWWREHASEYPLLGRMACDYLTMPFSVILNGSSAANEKAMMDNPIWKGLDPLTIEAMVCTKDWLECPQER